MRLEHAHARAAHRGVDAVQTVGGIAEGPRVVAPPEAMQQGDSSGRPPAHEEGSVRRLILVTAVEFVVLVTILVGIAALIIDFEPLFALTYALSYGFLAAVGLIALAAVLWLLIAPGKSTIRAAREWNEARGAGAGLRVIGLAVWTVVAALIAVELVLVAVASCT